MKYLSGYAMQGKCRTCAPLLVPYLEQELDSNRRARVEAHLAICPACQADLAAANAVAHALNGYLAAPARTETDLWSRIESDIQKLPRRAPHAGRSRRPAPGSRSTVLGALSWGQALPLAASVFAAGVLVTAIFESAHQRSASAPIAAGTAQPAVVPQRIVLASQSSGGLRPTLSAASNRLVAVSRVPSDAIKHDRIDSNVVVRPVASDRRHSGTAARVNEQIAQLSFPSSSAKPSEKSARTAPVSFASGNLQRIAMISSSHRVSVRDGQVATLSDRYIGPLNVGPLSASAPTMSAEPPEAAGGGSQSSASGGRQSSSEKNAASRGSYAIDDEASANVSVADISGSVRRQQGLFSYTQQ